MLWPRAPEKKLKKIHYNGINVEILWALGHIGTDKGNAVSHTIAAQACRLDCAYTTLHPI